MSSCTSYKILVRLVGVNISWYSIILLFPGDRIYWEISLFHYTCKTIYCSNTDLWGHKFIRKGKTMKILEHWSPHELKWIHSSPWDQMQYFHCNHLYFIPVTVTVLAEGFDINEKVEDFDNQTPLHAACISGSLPIVHVLVQVQFSPLIALNFEHNVISFVKGDNGMWYFVFCFRWGHISML